MPKQQQKQKKKGKPSRARTGLDMRQTSSGPSFGPMELAPVATARSFQARKPMITYAKDGSNCIVRHCERIGTILGSAAFTVNEFNINPGLAATFPWLSQIAQRFESYRFRRLEFHYRTKCATSFVGDVIQTVDYDAGDPAPITSVQAEGYMGAASCAPWQDKDHISAPLNLRKVNSYYVRAGALAGNLDIKSYDVGNLFVCTENQADRKSVV